MLQIVGNPVIPHRADADLAALQINQHRHWCTKATRRFAYLGQTPGVLLVVAVAEVESNHINTATQDGVDHARRIGGWAEGGHHLGPGRRLIVTLHIDCRHYCLLIAARMPPRRRHSKSVRYIETLVYPP